MSSQIDNCHSIDDLRVLAKKALPKPLFDYIEGGAEDGWTLNRNRDSFNHSFFNPRVLTDVSSVDLSTQVQGINIETPVVLAPTGMSRMFHSKGEAALSAAAHKAGTIYGLSTV